MEIPHTELSSSRLARVGACVGEAIFTTPENTRQGRVGNGRRPPTLLRVWVCPMRMRALEEMMDRQKLMRMTDRSERMYL